MDYNYLLNRCRAVSETSSILIDELLIYYAAKQDKVDREFEARIARFKQVEKEMPSNWKGLIKAQYIAHRIFRQQGLIHKYLKSATIKARSNEEQEFLSNAAAVPWKFCFSQIRANPASNFYEMEDVFTGEVILLYSPAIARTLSDQPALLWFNLIGYNGDCWQTYGPVVAFQSFSADDIFFYATELNRSVESDDDLIADIDDNPVRYMVLACGSTYPLVVHQQHEVVQVTSDSNSAEFDVQSLRKDFRIEYADGVFKLSHEVWSEPPYYAEAFYEEAKSRLLLNALTDKGYYEMSKVLHSYGMNIAPEPDIRLHLSMIQTIKKTLNRKIELNPYGSLFEQKPTTESGAEMAKLNQLLSLALPYINSGQQFDITALAKEAGVDPEVAENLIQQSIGRIKKLRG